MEYLDIEERPELARAQVSKPANIVEVGEDGNPPFYVAISQMLDNDTGWLASAPRPRGSGPDIENILKRVWLAFDAQRECRSPNTMRWHVYRLEGRRSWLVQKFEIFRYDAILVDFDEWSEKIEEHNAKVESAEDVRDRRAAMKVVGREAP